MARVDPPFAPVCRLPQCRCYFEIEIVRAVTGWAGCLRLFYLAGTMFRNKDFTEASGSPGTYNTEDLDVGTHLGLLYDCDTHQLQYFHDGKPYNKPFKYVEPLPEDVPLHGVIEVYGKTSEVRLVQL
jgi:hypothetical protein